MSWNGQFGSHGLRWTDISLWLAENPGELIDNTLGEEVQALKARLET